MVQASPIYIPSVNNDKGWDFCFHLSHQTKNPSQQQADELYSSSGSGESDGDTETKEEAISALSLPMEKLVQSQKKVTHLIKDKMNIQANRELIRCVILSRIIFGEEHWKCAQAVARLAYGYLTLRETEALEVRLTFVSGQDGQGQGYRGELGNFPVQTVRQEESIENDDGDRLIEDCHQTCLPHFPLSFPELEPGDVAKKLVPLNKQFSCGYLAKKHAESAKSILLTWKGSITSDKEKKEILETLVMIHYTLGVSWLLLNQEAYVHLQKAERHMKELREFYQRSSCEFRVSENDLIIALGRASLATQKLDLALAYFEKAIDNVITAKGDKTSDLVSLYEKIAQIEQLRKNHGQVMQYWQQVPHHLSVLGRGSSVTHSKRKRHRCN